MPKILTTLNHPDQMINRIQDGIVSTLNPLLKAWYSKFSTPGDCSASLIERTVTLADDWIAPTLLNSWANVGGATNPDAAYRKRHGSIELVGYIQSGTPPSTAFVLPSGYWPPMYVRRGLIGGGAFAYVYVSPIDGSVVIQSGATPHTIDCMFQALDPTPFPNPIFPLTLPHSLGPGHSPTAVILADAMDTTSLEHVSSRCSWKQYDQKQIQIVDLPDLHATRTYDLTFLVLGG